MEQRAFAIAIATVMVAAGLSLSVVPTATALEANCSEDFEIAGSESLSQQRSLEPNETKVGHREVISGAAEDLNVRLESSGDELTWQVFYTNSTGACVDYTAGGCNGENVIDKENEKQNCTLQDPSSGSRDYYVVFKNTEDSPDPMEDLKFRVWAPSV